LPFSEKLQLFPNGYSATLSIPLLASIFPEFFSWHQGNISAFLGKMAKLAIIIVYFVELEAARNRVENLPIPTLPSNHKLLEIDKIC